jgi:hypothetical protein
MQGTKDMTLDLQELRSFGNALHPLIVEARADSQRGDQGRCPYFRPVSIATDDGHRYSAFSRDISARGIGLLHNMELAAGEFDIAIRAGHGYSVKIRTRITGCRLCGEGWYTSDGQFLSCIAVRQPL